MREDDGRNILLLMQQLRRLMTEVSRMLLEADSLMEQSDWEGRVGSTALFGGSYTIGNPRGWIPNHIFRFYRQQRIPTAVPCISVLLESPPTEVKLTEPLVSGLLMEYEADDPIPEGRALYEIATWHLYVPGRSDDGAVMQVEPRKLWVDKSTAKKMTSFACPLVTIDGRESLERKVVAPLLQIIHEAYPGL